MCDNKFHNQHDPRRVMPPERINLLAIRKRNWPRGQMFSADFTLASDDLKLIRISYDHMIRSYAYSTNMRYNWELIQCCAVSSDIKHKQTFISSANCSKVLWMSLAERRSVPREPWPLIAVSAIWLSQEFIWNTATFVGSAIENKQLSQLQSFRWLKNG